MGKVRLFSASESPTGFHRSHRYRSFMESLAPPASHHVMAAIGWMELGDLSEALAELDKLDPTIQQHLEVLEVRWSILAAQRDWDTAAKIGRALIAADPERPSGWLHHSYALRPA